MSPPAPPPSRLESACSRLLGWPMAAGLAVLCLIQLATWAPGYLTWPWWADHDVFATMARAWHAGILPYRDFAGNNFPATTYVFWLLGVLGGWGRTAPFWAFDAALVLSLGGLLVAWSRRRLGRAGPGWVGYALFLGYYLNLDYTQAAQRDWQGPFFAVAALLVLQAAPGRPGRLASAALMATAIAFRPQTVLFAPGLLLAVRNEPAGPEAGRPTVRRLAAVAAWGAAFAAALTAAFAPLIAAGLLPDFARSLRAVAYGGGYNRVGPMSFAQETLRQLAPLRIWAVPATLALLWPGAPNLLRRTARPWLLASLGVLLYRPLSPVAHAYLTHPLALAWAVLAALLAGFVLEAPRLLPSYRLAMLLLLLGLNVTAKPRFSNPNGSREALGWLRAGVDPGPSPTGYVANPEVRSSGRYAWDDYRSLLDHLRHDLDPDLRVANALKFVPAVAGPAGRLSAFPAESIAWLTGVRPDDEPRFVAALRAEPRSVVVWCPAEKTVPNLPPLNDLTAAIEELYEPHRRFGAIEVWTRRPPAALARR